MSRALTPAYALHPPHTLACASILLSTRLLRIALPQGWERLFDAEWDDVWGVAGLVMVLWRDWGSALASSAGGSGGGERVKGDEEGVRRSRSQGGDDVEGERRGGEEAAEGKEQEKDKEAARAKGKGDRWRRAWVLCGSRKAVRRWVQESTARDTPL